MGKILIGGEGGGNAAAAAVGEEAFQDQEPQITFFLAYHLLPFFCLTMKGFSFRKKEVAFMK